MVEFTWPSVEGAHNYMVEKRVAGSELSELVSELAATGLIADHNYHVKIHRMDHMVTTSREHWNRGNNFLFLA